MVLGHSFDRIEKTSISDSFEVFCLRIQYLYDFWTSAAVISCWHNRDNFPERKIEQYSLDDREKKKLNAYRPLKIKIEISWGK